LTNIESEFFVKKLIKKNNLLIFSVVSFLAAQNLFFLSNFEINFPYSVDFSDEFNDIFYFIIEGKERFLATKGFHIILFPKLIAFPFLYFFKFDVTHLYYLQWIVNSLSLYIFYLIIKQTEKKLFWTLIPIAAFIFNPLTSSGYWSISLLPWLFPMLGMILIVYLFNRKKINVSVFSSGILVAIFSTFSIVVGAVVWIIGILTLSNNQYEDQRKKLLLLWMMGILIVGIFYFNLVSESNEEIHFESLFSFSGFSFITHYIASSFRLKFEFLMMSVGSISLFLSGIFIIIFSKKDYFRDYIPWFTFLLVGISGALITAIGRVQFLDSHLGNEPYYSPISQLFQIGLIVLAGKLIYEFRKIPKKNILVSILIFLIISQMILLIPSYYSGWERGKYYFEEKTRYVSCFSLQPDYSCKDIIPTLDDNFLHMINYLIKNKYSIFDEHEFQIENNSEVMNFIEFKNSKKINSLKNHVISINDFNVGEDSIIIEEPKISINGSITIPKDSVVEELYITIDNVPLQKINKNNIQILDGSHSSNIILWSTYLMSGYIEPGCHSLKIFGISNSEEIYLVNEISICV
tara:strand:- start:11429 stop:13156 length:1728 start_codon:yes stop_codon:yes gene_type:complete